MTTPQSMPADGALSTPAKRAVIADAFHIIRAHIMGLAMISSVIFGWLFTGRYLWWVPLLVGIDWYFINIINRVTDLSEDAANGIHATDMVARNRHLIAVTAWALLIGSLIVSHLAAPGMTPWRLAVFAIGIAYNYNLIPTPGGLRRFKELYFFKNFGSATIMVLTCFAYPITYAGVPFALLDVPRLVTMLSFFVLFELSYEVIYDLRDHKGDREHGVPTYPVVHGIAVACRIVDALIITSGLALAIGFFTRSIGLLEALMVAGPVIQWLFYRHKMAHGGLRPRDCIVLTSTGIILMAVYGCGTWLWLQAGLPGNIYL